MKNSMFRNENQPRRSRFVRRQVGLAATISWLQELRREKRREARRVRELAEVLHCLRVGFLDTDLGDGLRAQQ